MKPGDLITYKGRPALVHSVGKFQVLDAYNVSSNLVRCTDEITLYIFDEDGAGHYDRVIKETEFYPVQLPDVWKATHPERRRIECHPSVISVATSVALRPSTESASKDQPALDLPRSTTPEELASTSAQPTVLSNSLKSEEVP